MVLIPMPCPVIQPPNATIIAYKTVCPNGDFSVVLDFLLRPSVFNLDLFCGVLDKQTIAH